MAPHKNNLSQNRLDENNGTFIWGVHPIVELLKAKKRQIYTIYTTNPTPRSWDIIAPLLNKKIRIVSTTKEKLYALTHTYEHQGIVALVAAFPFRTQLFTPQTHPSLIFMYGLQDPRNVGAILRSVYCTGFHGVIITSKQTAPLEGVVAKSSAGLMEHLDIHQTSNATHTLSLLEKQGYSLYFAAIKGKQDIRTAPLTTPLCIVIGNEGKGLPSNMCTGATTIVIPQQDHLASYNASVAAALLMFQVSIKNNLFEVSK